MCCGWVGGWVVVVVVVVDALAGKGWWRRWEGVGTPTARVRYLVILLAPAFLPIVHELVHHYLLAARALAHLGERVGARRLEQILGVEPLGVPAKLVVLQQRGRDTSARSRIRIANIRKQSCHA